MKRAIVLLLAGVALAACSDTTLRRDTYATVEIGGQPLQVSWIRVDKQIFDLAVEGKGGAPLDLAAAQAAAERVAGRHCLFDRILAVAPPVQWSDGRYAFRYACGQPKAE